MPPPPLRVRLDPAAQAELERRYQTTRDAETRTRYQMVLLNAQGHTAAQVAQLTRRSPDTVRRVLRRYLAGGLDAVPHRPHPAPPPQAILFPMPPWPTACSPEARRRFWGWWAAPDCSCKTKLKSACT